jgi:hypothetical protein
MTRRADLLVFAIVALTILGLFLPLVYAKDTEADRLETAQRLKWCLLAVHNFHATYRRFPDAFGPGGKYPDEPKSVWFHLLPYVEADAVYKAGDTMNIVPNYLGPFDPSLDEHSGRLTFAANLRVFGHETLGKECDKPGEALTLPKAGTPIKSGLTMPRVIDGTSNTFMLTTRYASCDGKANLYASHPSDFGGFFGAGKHDKAPRMERDDDLIWQVKPTERTCNAKAGVYGHSFSEKGLLIGLVDGTVRTITERMGPITFGRALSPCDHQPLGVDF